MGAVSRAEAAELHRPTIGAWEAYVQAVDRRIENEFRSPRGFLAIDFLSPGGAQSERAALRGGDVTVHEMKATGPNAADIEVPDGLIHHWIGVMFVPNVKLETILARVRSERVQDHRQADVLESRVLARDEDSMRIFLKLVRSKIVTVTYNTEHLVRYRRHGNLRASSRSTATKIAELERANRPQEREKPEGIDSGFLWRLNSYWRYEQVDGGVFVECESISLSRSIPWGLGPVVRPIVDQIARESMRRTLSSMRARFATSSTLAASLRLAARQHLRYMEGETLAVLHTSGGTRGRLGRRRSASAQPRSSCAAWRG